MNLRIALYTLLLSSISLSLSGQISSNSWAEFDEDNDNSGLERWIVPDKYRAVTIEKRSTTLLGNVINQENGASVEIDIPLPDGGFEKFAVSRNQVLPQALAAKFPQIITMTGESLDRPSRRIYMDLTPSGLHGMIIGEGQTIFLDPYFNGNDEVYVSYYKKDFSRSPLNGWSCDFDNDKALEIKQDRLKLEPEIKFQNKRRTALVTKRYRLAVAVTGEYTALFGGTVAGGLASVVTAINRVTGIYETEVGVELTLVPNNDLIIFTDAGTDPFVNASSDINRVQAAIDSRIGSANYDVGHVFTSSNGGVASLGVVCINGSKARGMTGLPNPTGDPFYVDYVSHEIGHQFDGLHTFNGDSNACSGGNRSGSAAYEPGSGATIQAYAGICGNDNLQNNSDAYFHLKSLMEITDLINGSAASCAQEINFGNNMPTSNANVNGINGKMIPASTPFELTGDGSDIDGDNLTYQWDQWNLGPQRDLNAPDNGSSPIIRSFFATSSKTRVIPNIDDLLNNTTTLGERLPTADWTSMNFQFTVRDNKGGWMNDMITISVVSAAGPFLVTSQNTGGTISGTINVTWDVAGTDANGINCADVDVLLSTDGGRTYDIVLADDIDNNGSASITLPEIFVDNARIKVKCSDNIFFDINNEPLVVIPSSVPCNTVSEITANPIADGIYSSAAELSASGAVPLDGDVIFTGTTAVNILDDFEVINTGQLEARIYPCTVTRE